MLEDTLLSARTQRQKQRIRTGSPSEPNKFIWILLDHRKQFQ